MVLFILCAVFLLSRVQRKNQEFLVVFMTNSPFRSHMPYQLQRNSPYIFQAELKRDFLIWIIVVTTIVNKKLSEICV